MPAKCNEISFNTDGTVTLTDNTEQCCTSLGHTWINGVCYWKPPVPGCTDPNADNYNTSATQDDGSCTYTGIPQPINCFGNIIFEDSFDSNINKGWSGLLIGGQGEESTLITNESLRFTSGQGIGLFNSFLSFDNILEIGKIYEISFDITNIPQLSLGNSKVTVNCGTNEGIDRIFTGTFKETITCTGNQNLGFKFIFESIVSVQGENIDIDNIEVKCIGDSIVVPPIIDTPETPTPNLVKFDFCDTEEEISESVVFNREIKFMKNLESNDKELYNNLDLTVRLDRMMNYMLAESSKDKLGLVEDNSFDVNLKSPFADFYNEIVVVTSAKTTSGTEVTMERKPIMFKIGDGSKKNLDQFKKYFNVNQTVISSDPIVSPPPSDYLEIEKVSKTDINTSPLVLSLSSFDNKALSGFNENKQFSNDLVAGSGRGGIMINPRASGYLVNITDTLKDKGINYSKVNNVDKLSTDERLFYRVTDIEDKTFTYQDQNGIVPSTIIDNGDQRVFTAKQSVLDNSDISTGLMGMSDTNPDQSFQNQYLKLYDRELIKEEVQMMGNFITNNEGIKDFKTDDLPLFKIEKESFLRGVSTPLVYTTTDSIYLEAKTDDPSIKVGSLKITLKADFESEITNEDLLGSQPLDDLKNLRLTGGTYSSQSFVIYN